MKAWFIMEHFRHTGDRSYLEAQYPRLLANSRWQERQRRKTRFLVEGKRPLTYGLMPRGMGDGGLLGEDGSLYGIFFTHNFLAVYADALAVEAAQILAKESDLLELRAIHLSALTDLQIALEDGAINEDGYRWIRGVPGYSGGSRWGALYSTFPWRCTTP